MGFGQFIEHFAAIIEELWLPVAWDDILGRKYLVALKSAAKRERTEEARSADPGTILAELESIKNWIDSHPGHLDFIKSNMVKPLNCGEDLLEFVCYAPDAHAIREIGKVLSDALSDARVDPDSPWVVLSPEKLPVDAKWNLLSSVMLLRWGKAEFLFCGDAEKGTWDRILGTAEAPKQPGRVDWRVTYVKIGHHGSHTGLNDRLYGYLASNSSPVGVLTPFNLGSPDKRLPTVDGIQAYGSNLDSTYTTCMKSSLHAGTWEQPVEEEATSVGLRPEQLTGVLEQYLVEYPSLAQALCSASEEQLAQWLSSSDGIPAHMLEEFELRPELAFAFHAVIQEMLSAATGPDAFSIENQFRVSHYFTDSGQLQSRELGNGTGRLAKPT